MEVLTIKILQNQSLLLRKHQQKQLHSLTLMMTILVVHQSLNSKQITIISINSKIIINNISISRNTIKVIKTTTIKMINNTIIHNLPNRTIVKPCQDNLYQRLLNRLTQIKKISPIKEEILLKLEPLKQQLSQNLLKRK